MGVFVERLVGLAAERTKVTVVCPVPWAPPLPFSTPFDRYRRVERRRVAENAVRVEYPRVPAGPGHLLHSVESWLRYLPLRRTVDRIRRERGFDLIHAHLIYPEGVVAARLGRRYGVPVVTTEHAMWKPWLEDYPLVRRQVTSALEHIAVVSVVSEALGRQVEEVVGSRARVQLLPNAVDEDVFMPFAGAEPRDPDRLLFVGTVRKVKGLDVLVRALPGIVDARPTARLRVVGEPFLRSYRRDEEEVRSLVADLGLTDRVDFVGGLRPAAVAEEMRRAAVLVVPSRRETFATVIPEALACGTPVVATRCGGPQEILTPDLGILVPTEDPPALAEAVARVLSRPSDFRVQRLRDSAVERYGREATVRRLHDLYGRALEGGGVAGGSD